MKTKKLLILISLLLLTNFSRAYEFSINLDITHGKFMGVYLEDDGKYHISEYDLPTIRNINIDLTRDDCSLPWEDETPCWYATFFDDIQYDNSMSGHITLTISKAAPHLNFKIYFGYILKNGRSTIENKNIELEVKNLKDLNNVLYSLKVNYSEMPKIYRESYKVLLNFIN